MKINPKKILLFLIAMIVISFSFTLLSWLFNFSGVFFFEDLFSFTNPLGIVSIVLILVVGGFYLFKIGFSVLKGLI